MQNKFVILALLGLANASQSVQVNTKTINKPVQQSVAQQAKPQKMVQKKAPADEEAKSKSAAANIAPPSLMKATESMANTKDVWGLLHSKAAIHEDIRSQAREMDINPPSLEAIKKNMWVPDAAELLKDTEGVNKLMKEVRVIGGDSGKKNKSKAMTDADVACYVARYSDLKDKPAREHFRLIGDAQGRQDTCARELSDYEAQTYLHKFPELQVKFGDGLSAISQAKNHYREYGYTQAKYSKEMTDTKKTAWKCGVGAKQSCKCHGTLWYGPTVRPDDKKPIESWDAMREWKTLTKESEEWMSCTDANFGSDPWPEQEKQCYCEDKPAYKPWKCAEDGEECLCDGGWVVYGAKADADKKENDFFGMIQLSLAVTGTKGKKSVQCGAGTFGGADPAPAADKVCFCDQQQKFFDSSFVKATKTFWKSSQLEKQAESELKRTGEHSSEVEKVTKEREATATEATTAQKVENEKAIEDIGAAKKCAITAIEESYKFRQAKVNQKKVLLERAIAKRRSQVTTWQFQLNVKKNAMEHTCAQASRKSTADRVRFEIECKRVTQEIEELTTQISVEVTKINEEERVGVTEIRTEQTSLESKRTKETIAVQEKADEDVNEVNEGNTEKELDLAEEKEALLQQQQELIKIQQKTSKAIELSIKEQQGAIAILIDNLRKNVTKMTRKEEILISELSDDAAERKTVVERILKRSKETVEKLTKVQDELKDKKEKITKETSSLKDDIKGMTEKLSAIQAKIATSHETLKLKIAERTMKKNLLTGHQEKSGQKSGSQTMGSAVSIESSLKAEGAVIKLTKEVSELRESIKKNIQQKNEFFSTKITSQKQIDLQTNQVKTIEEQLKNIKDFISEVETTIETVETKQKEEKVTKKVIEAQKEAFKAVQKKTDADEALNSHRVISEQKKDAKTIESKECKKTFDVASSGLKQLQDQAKTLKKTKEEGKGSKEEKARVESEVEAIDKQVDEAQKEVDSQKKDCKEIDDGLKEIVEKSKEKIEKLTKTIEEAKESVEKAEKEAKETISDLPGGAKDIEKLEEEEKKEIKEEEKLTKTTTNTSVAISTSGSSKGVTGKPKPPSVPAPKKEEKPAPAAPGEKPKPADPKKPVDPKKPAPKPEEPAPAPEVEPEVEIPVAPIVRPKPAKVVGGQVISDDDEDDGEPADVNPTEVPGGEAQITKEVTENTKAAHVARVEMVKTKETLGYELETIKETLKKYSESIKEVRKKMETDQAEIKTENAKLESMKTSSITAKLKDTNKQKLEVEIAGQVTKITDLEAKITKAEALLIDFKGKTANLVERRKEIKYQIEVKVLESKEAESAVTEAIKTVTDVELLARKRFIASKSVGSYHHCSKLMSEYKMIYEKQTTIMTQELSEHGRRVDVADGAVSSLKEKKKSLDDVKEKTKAIENALAAIDSQIEMHEKVIKAEGKLVDTLKEKKEKNHKEYDEHVDKCAKQKKKANVAVAGVNDAATTLKNQREFQVQVTNLKNLLVTSHEQALTKRQEANKIHQNYTQMITKFEQQTSMTNEQIMEAKTRISGAQEIQRIIAVRMKEVTTLLSRPTITASEKSKLTSEQSEIVLKLEQQQNTVDMETKSLVEFETSLATLATTIKTFKGYVAELKEVVKTLEKKVIETKAALKDPNGEPAKKEEEKKEEEGEDKTRDEDGDLKVDEEETKEEEEKTEVKGGNEKVDKELDQVEEENKSTSKQIESLTKTITSVEEKSEAADKEVIKETTNTAKEEAALTEIKHEKERLVRVRERQRCARLFPVAFSSFKIGEELRQENMCPCPGNGKGLTMLFLDAIKDSSEFDKYVLHLFEKNLAVEGSFQSQVQKMAPGPDDKPKASDEESITLKLVVSDDKIDSVMEALDAQNLSKKSTDFKISPLLKGKAEYQKWQATQAAGRQSSKVHIASGDLEDDMADEMEME